MQNKATRTGLGPLAALLVLAAASLLSACDRRAPDPQAPSTGTPPPATTTPAPPPPAPAASPASQ